MPKQRKLDEASKSEARELLKLKVNKKLFQEHLSCMSGKVVTLKDMVNATYKLNELRMPLYLMMVVDSNGQSEIVVMFFTLVETKQVITDMIYAFKEVNPA